MPYNQIHWSFFLAFNVEEEIVSIKYHYHYTFDTEMPGWVELPGVSPSHSTATWGARRQYQVPMLWCSGAGLSRSVWSLPPPAPLPQPPAGQANVRVNPRENYISYSSNWSSWLWYVLHACLYECTVCFFVMLPQHFYDFFIFWLMNSTVQENETKYKMRIRGAKTLETLKQCNYFWDQYLAMPLLSCGHPGHQTTGSCQYPWVSLCCRLNGLPVRLEVMKSW